jgi:hypothetical protein
MKLFIRILITICSLLIAEQMVSCIRQALLITACRCYCIQFAAQNLEREGSLSSRVREKEREKLKRLSIDLQDD